MKKLEFEDKWMILMAFVVIVVLVLGILEVTHDKNGDVVKKIMLDDVRPDAYLIWKDGMKDSTVAEDDIEADFKYMMMWYHDHHLEVPKWLKDDYKEFIEQRKKEENNGA